MPNALEVRLDDVLLSQRQFEVLNYYAAEIDLTGQVPSTSEVTRHFGVCRTTIYNTLNALRRRGFVEREHNTRLALRLTDKARTFPLIGTVDEHGRVRLTLSTP
jgi:DNA-binding MarR family transcriptional regulator